MTTAQPDPQAQPPQHAFHGFDQSFVRLFGADFRMIYGMAVPILMVIGMIVILALTPTTWLVVAIVLLEMAGLSTVVYGLFGMLNEREEDEIS
ncbi:MAG: hypothetical protein ABSG43_00855 [Solirubrobacteraceae bacterium]|jgi:hypothetical protein